jgi:hypothetical protein
MTLQDVGCQIGSPGQVFSHAGRKLNGNLAGGELRQVKAESGADWWQCSSIHSSHMMVDETVLPRGTAFLAGCATRFLERGWD